MGFSGLPGPRTVHCVSTLQYDRPKKKQESNQDKLELERRCGIRWEEEEGKPQLVLAVEAGRFLQDRAYGPPSARRRAVQSKLFNIPDRHAQRPSITPDLDSRLLWETNK